MIIFKIPDDNKYSVISSHVCKDLITKAFVKQFIASVLNFELIFY